MRTRQVLRHSVVCLGLLAPIFVPSLLAGADPAEGSLAWRFTAGQALVWTSEQTVRLRAEQEDQAFMRRVIDFDVDVVSVENGVAKLSVVTSRIRDEVTQPDFKLTYDSAQPAAGDKKANGDAPSKKKEDDLDPDQIAKDFYVAMLAPLRDLKVAVALDRKCAVQSIAVDDEILEAFKSVRPLQSLMILVEKSGFSSVYLGGFVQLPDDDLPAGQTWSSKVVSYGAGLLGKASFEHKLRRDGTARVDGHDLQKFSGTVDMSFDGPRFKEVNNFMKLSKQAGTAELYFDPQQGRVYGSEWTVTAELLVGLTDEKKAIEMKLGIKSQLRDREKPKTD